MFDVGGGHVGFRPGIESPTPRWYYSIMSVPRIVFRVDASLQIGSGHLMRCLTLADELRASGASSVFVVREQPGSLIELVVERGHAVIRLTESQRVDPGDDARETREALGDLSVDWLIVDHYGLAASWERSLRDRIGKVMVIDDLANRSHDCDVLLDQNLRHDAQRRYAPLVPAHCRLLLGPRHVLLRKGFDQVPVRNWRREPRRILIYMGGMDQYNQAGKALAALGHVPDMHIDVVLGLGHPFAAEIHAMGKAQPRVCVMDAVADMAGIMTAADLGIGVCGMAAWERCALALPSLTCIIAENQREDALELDRIGAAKLVGDASQIQVGDWKSAIDEVIGDLSRLAVMAEVAQGVVAGHAKQRRDLIERLCAHGR